MRLVSWNCQTAFRGAKVEALLALSPDLAVIQECSEKDVATLSGYGFSSLWGGRNPHKGAAVIARRGLRLELDPSYDPDFAFYIPARVTGDLTISLLGIWAFHHRALTDKKWPTAEIFGYYRKFLSAPRVLAMGDFNDHPRWDTPAKPSFRNARSTLESLGLRSVWHSLSGCAHGEESRGTLYMYRKVERPYHIDYCFASESLTAVRADIGATDTWLGLSDHCPLIVDLAQ